MSYYNLPSHYQTADIGIGSLQMTNQRHKEIDFLFPHTLTPLTFITNFAEQSVLQSERLMILDWSVHLANLCSALIIYFVMRLSNENKSKQVSSSFLWTLLAIVLRQTFNQRIARSFVTRILLSVWEMACLILAIFVGAFSFNSMATSRSIKTIDTLCELAEAHRENTIDIYIYQNSADYTELEVWFNKYLILFDSTSPC